MKGEEYLWLGRDVLCVKLKRPVLKGCQLLPKLGNKPLGRSPLNAVGVDQQSTVLRQEEPVTCVSSISAVNTHIYSHSPSPNTKT